MGRAKSLLSLPSSGETFVARIIGAVLEGGAADALVVGRPEDLALRAEIARGFDPVHPSNAPQPLRRARFVENPRADTGQLSSVIAGLDAADRPGVHAILVTPVDMPLVRPATVAALLTAFSSSPHPIVRATHRGRHGHPVIFGRAVFDALRRADPEIGARAVVRAHSVLDVEVNDPGVLQDVDTPDDYRRLTSSSES